MITRCILAVAAVLAAIAVPASAAQIAPDALRDLPLADVYVLGEIHDNPAHHVNQAEAVAALAPKAVVFEMLTDDQARQVTPDIYGDAAALAKALGWDESGWPDFAMYHPIFVAGADARILGGALPRAVVRGAVTDGAAAAFGEGAEAFGLDRPLDPDELSLRVAGQAEAHCNALPEDLLPGMVEAQRLRDAALARAVRTALETVGGPVAVITGNGHARRDRGLARMLAAIEPQLRIVTLGQFEDDPGPDAPHDYWLLTAGVERDDPCAVFAR